MDQIRDAIYYEQLANQARKKADEHSDPDVTRRLREAAVRHERKVRQLRRLELTSGNSLKVWNFPAFWRNSQL